MEERGVLYLCLYYSLFNRYGCNTLIHRKKIFEKLGTNLKLMIEINNISETFEEETSSVSTSGEIVKTKINNILRHTNYFTTFFSFASYPSVAAVAAEVWQQEIFSPPWSDSPA